MATLRRATANFKDVVIGFQRFVAENVREVPGLQSLQLVGPEARTEMKWENVVIDKHGTCWKTTQTPQRTRQPNSQVKQPGEGDQPAEGEGQVDVPNAEVRGSHDSRKDWMEKAQLAQLELEKAIRQRAAELKQIATGGQSDAATIQAGGNQTGRGKEGGACYSPQESD